MGGERRLYGHAGARVEAREGWLQRLVAEGEQFVSGPMST